MGTKSNPGQFDCYAAAGDDEPLFVLLGRDPAAPEAIRHWAETRLNHAGGKPDGRESAKIAEAMACARAMEAFAQGERPKSVSAAELTQGIAAVITIEGVVAEAMATAYRQGWDDAAAYHGNPRRFWWQRWHDKPAPNGDRARELLADDWVPHAKPVFFNRIATAIGSIKRLQGLMRSPVPVGTRASGKRALMIIGDEIAAEVAAGRMSANEARAAE